MTDDAVRLLCTGDVHIGRRPSRLPAHVEGRRFSAKAAWKRIVDVAIDRDVDALVLTGDVVDRENRYYEAIGPLEQGLRRLSDAGIETFAVAGNHDFDVFPEIVESLDVDGFTLLGSRGTWTREALVLDGEDEPRLIFDGFSFPSQHVPRSPLDTYDLDPTDVPVLGVLHADVDPGVDASYAPVQAADLARAGPDAWLLGHIHHPGLHETETGVAYLYPGSPQPLDPGEPGVHGPWLLEVDADGAIEAEQLATATVRYEGLDVDLEGVEDDAQVRARLNERLRSAVRDELEGLGAVEHLVSRPRLTGRTELHGRLAGIVSDAGQDLELPLDGTTVSVDKVSVETRPALDLEDLAKTRTPSGELAQIVLTLDDGDGAGTETEAEPETVQALLDEARERVREVDRSNTYTPVFDHDEELEPVDRVDVRELVRRQALLLIEELERQQEEAPS